MGEELLDWGSEAAIGGYCLLHTEPSAENQAEPYRETGVLLGWHNDSEFQSP